MSKSTAELPNPFSGPGTSAKPRVLSVWMRGLDIICCLLALPLLSASTAVMAVIVGVASPGPIFFRQERVGLRGRRFQIFKFRTMRTGADARDQESHFRSLMLTNTPMVKLDAKLDSRLIPGAWILRASGLDELPQIINVLRGEMTLVGPRPSIPSEFELFAPAQRERVSVRPGLTGLWQVSGKNRTTFEEMIRLDVHYVQHASLLLNVRIMLLTPWALLMQIAEVRNGRKAFGLLVPPRPAGAKSSRKRHSCDSHQGQPCVYQHESYDDVLHASPNRSVVPVLSD